jgi:hypothetical protein
MTLGRPGGSPRLARQMPQGFTRKARKWLNVHTQ